MTRKQIKADLLQAAQDGRAEDTRRLFTRLVFWRAKPYEYRGVSDARLTKAELATIAFAFVGTNWFDSIFSILCPDIE